MHINILKSYSKSEDKEFIRVIQLIPKWKPGMFEVKALEYKFVFPLEMPYSQEILYH